MIYLCIIYLALDLCYIVNLFLCDCLYGLYDMDFLSSIDQMFSSTIKNLLKIMCVFNILCTVFKCVIFIDNNILICLCAHLSLLMKPTVFGQWSFL